jgi:hypothetical protein
VSEFLLCCGESEVEEFAVALKLSVGEREENLVKAGNAFFEKPTTYDLDVVKIMSSELLLEVINEAFNLS